MLHIYVDTKHVAMIDQQPKAADSYRPEEPWLLLHNSGRVDRFASQREARQEARKTYGFVLFKRT